MDSDASRSFGFLIAYALPGFTLLWMMASLFPSIETWLTGGLGTTPAFGGVVYAAAASIMFGMILNAFRWVLVDTIHHLTGLKQPLLNDRILDGKLKAFTRLVEDHFRYHQFYANTLLALLVGYPAWRGSSAEITSISTFDASLGPPREPPPCGQAARSRLRHRLGTGPRRPACTR